MEEKEEEGGRLGRAAGAETGARTHDGELITHIISPQITSHIFDGGEAEHFIILILFWRRLGGVKES